MSFLERLNICLAEKGKGSGNLVQKHVAFAPRLRSPLLQRATMPGSAFLTVFSPYSLRQAGKTGKKVACLFFI
jgi:hypothetical protein